MVILKDDAGDPVLDDDGEVMMVPEEYEANVHSSTTRIKDGLTWSDGSPLNAHDVAFTANTALDLQLPGNWLGYFPADVIDPVEVVDDLTVKFYFSRIPGLAEWQFGAAFAPIVPNEYWEPLVAGLLAEYDDPTTEVVDTAVHDQLFSIEAYDEPVAGPATVLSVEADAFISLESNDAYYLADSSVKQYSDGTTQETIAGETENYYGDATGEVELEFTRNPQQDTTIFTVYQNPDAAVLALRNGDADYFLSPLGLAPGLRAQVEAADELEVFQNPANGYRYIGFNTRREPFGDVAFRQAVAVLIDLDIIANDLLQGVVIPIYSVVSEGNSAWYNPDTPRYGIGLDRGERIAEAVRILTDAGYSWDTEPEWDAANQRAIAGEGFRGTDGSLIEEFKITSVTQGYDALRFTAATAIEGWLQQAGIPAIAEPREFGDIVEDVFGRQEFDMWVLGWGAGIYPNFTFNTYSESQAGLDGNNAGGWVNAEYEVLLADFLSETDVDKAREFALQMQDIIARELPVITLFTSPIVEAYRPDVLEFAYTEVLDGVQNLFSGTAGPLATTTFSSSTIE